MYLRDLGVKLATISVRHFFLSPVGLKLCGHATRHGRSLRVYSVARGIDCSRGSYVILMSQKNDLGVEVPVCYSEYNSEQVDRAEHCRIKWLPVGYWGKALDKSEGRINFEETMEPWFLLDRPPIAPAMIH